MEEFSLFRGAVACVCNSALASDHLCFCETSAGSSKPVPDHRNQCRIMKTELFAGLA
jgi:hypothetical protein